MEVAKARLWSSCNPTSDNKIKITNRNNGNYENQINTICSFLTKQNCLTSSISNLIHRSSQNENSFPFNWTRSRKKNK